MSAIIADFKSEAAKSTHHTGMPGLVRERGYYDHIIRDDEDLARIRKYIQGNAAKWEHDRLFVKS